MVDIERIKRIGHLKRIKGVKHAIWHIKCITETKLWTGQPRPSHPTHQESRTDRGASPIKRIKRIEAVNCIRQANPMGHARSMKHIKHAKQTEHVKRIKHQRSNISGAAACGSTVGAGGDWDPK